MENGTEDRPRIGAGDVEITLGGADYVLRPSLRICETLAGQRGGIHELIQRCMQWEMPAIVLVIKTGISDPYKHGLKVKDLPELCYEAGLATLAPLAIRFLGIVSHGGRPPQPLTEESRGEAEVAEPDPLAGES